MIIVSYLLARDFRLAVLRAVHDVLENGGEGRDPNSSPHQHRHVKLEPVLVTLPVRTVQVDLTINKLITQTLVTAGYRLIEPTFGKGLPPRSAGSY